MNKPTKAEKQIKKTVLRSLQSPTKRKPAKRVVKGWAVIERDGQFRKAFVNESTAKLNVSSYAGELLVACSITYHLPPKTT